MHRGGQNLLTTWQTRVSHQVISKLRWLWICQSRFVFKPHYCKGWAP